MTRALALASRGEGCVEPNPMVGCVIARGDQVVGEGWHQQFGGPHAEVVALRHAADRATGATLYVTLEPCCHYGKTPPCTDAIVRAGVRRVVIAVRDPFLQVSGDGIAQLGAAGIACEVGVLAEDAHELIAPYLKLVTTGRPWLIAKWAMSLDGKIATAAGDSRWISGAKSREMVHRLRGRVDAIVVGAATARRDDPLLTARPADPLDLRRQAVRIVVSTTGILPANCQLLRTAADTPLLVAVGEEATSANREELSRAGAEVFCCVGETHQARLSALLVELGSRRLTNVLVEGGGKLLGNLFDMGAIDELHVFIAPKLIGGAGAPSPLMGVGSDRIAAAQLLNSFTTTRFDEDLYVHGRLAKPSGNSE